MAETTFLLFHIVAGDRSRCSFHYCKASTSFARDRWNLSKRLSSSTYDADKPSPAPQCVFSSCRVVQVHLPSFSLLIPLFSSQTQEDLPGSFFRSSTGKCCQDFAQSLNFKVVPRLFTSHPLSYNNGLQTTLWVTQKMFLFFQTFRRPTPSSVQRSTTVQIPKNTISLTKALIFETFERIKTSLCHP